METIQSPQINRIPELGRAPYERGELLKRLNTTIQSLRFTRGDKYRLKSGCKDVVDALDRCGGQSLQERWDSFERTVWPKWMAGQERRPTARWMWGARVVIMARLVLPGWDWLSRVHLVRWIARLAEGDLLLQEHDRLAKVVRTISWASLNGQHRAISTGIRILMVHGYGSLNEILEQDLNSIPAQSLGTDILDAALCSMGVFARTPQRAPARRLRRARQTIGELMRTH